MTLRLGHVPLSRLSYPGRMRRMPPLSLPADKVAARRVVRAARRERRASTSPEAWERYGECLATGLREWLSDRPVRSAAIYQALPSEPPTNNVRSALEVLGVRLLVPILLPDKDLSWRDLTTGDDLGVDAIATAELIVSPGLAVARHTGLRLGQGGGSYDRALLRVGRETPVITMLFDEELVEQVPAEPHDRAVHAVLTPSGGVTPVGRAV